jgi:hypothetical protein
MKLRRNAAITAFLIAVLALSGCTQPDIQPPVVPGLSVEEQEAQAKIDLERNRQQYLGAFGTVEVPEVERIRFISLDEWATVMADCLNVEGYEASAFNGALSTDAPEGQELPYALASYACSAKFPVNPRENTPLNEDQIRYLYEYYTQIATPCLEDLGITDLPEPPSMQSYISSYAGGPDWNIYDAAADQADEEKWLDLNEKCPQVPADLYG